MELTQLPIKINHAVQSNKCTQQKTNVLANANSKSFDQILSLIYILPAPSANGISENSFLLKDEGLSNLHLNSAVDEECLELDPIQQELFGLFQQLLLPTVRPTGQVDNQSAGGIHTETMVSQSDLQVIGEKLVQWLEKAGVIDQLTLNDKSQFIEQITQYAMELSTTKNKNQNVSKEMNQDQNNLKLSDPIKQLFAISEHAEKNMKNRNVTEWDITNEKIVTPLLMNTIPKSSEKLHLDKRLINTTLQVNLRTLEANLITDSYNHPFRDKLFIEQPTTGTEINNSLQDSVQDPLNTASNIVIETDKVAPEADPKKVKSQTGQLQVFIDSSPTDKPNTIEVSSAQEMSLFKTTGFSQTDIPTPEKSTITLSSFVPDISEWMGRFSKITKDKTGTSEAKFTMYPEHLGHLEIKIAVQKGHITAQIITDTQTAREALEGQLTMLKQTLQQHGLQVQKIEIIHDIPTATELNQGNNPSFSQGGSNQNQHQSNHSNEHTANTAMQTTEHSVEKEDGAMLQIDKDKSIPAYTTYGGKQVQSSSRIDFSA